MDGWGMGMGGGAEEGGMMAGDGEGGPLDGEWGSEDRGWGPEDGVDGQQGIREGLGPEDGGMGEGDSWMRGQLDRGLVPRDGGGDGLVQTLSQGAGSPGLTWGSGTVLSAMLGLKDAVG